MLFSTPSPARSAAGWDSMQPVHCSHLIQPLKLFPWNSPRDLLLVPLPCSWAFRFHLLLRALPWECSWNASAVLIPWFTGVCIVGSGELLPHPFPNRSKKVEEEEGWRKNKGRRRSRQRRRGRRRKGGVGWMEEEGEEEEGWRREGEEVAAVLWDNEKDDDLQTAGC